MAHAAGAEQAERRSRAAAGFPPSWRSVDPFGAAVVCVVQRLDCFWGTQGDLWPLA